MSRPEAALLFAAGLGTRMAPLTRTRPKPLIEVHGKPLINHALALVRDGGIGRVVANTHHLAPQMSRRLAQLGVAESHEPALLDTGGGLKAALPLLGDGEAVLTLNTDAVWTGPNPVPALLQAWEPGQMDALLLLVPRERATGHTGGGDFLLDAEGRLRRGEGHVYSGLQIIRTQPFTELPETVFGMHRVWWPMLEAGRAYGLMHRGGWCDVGRPECLPLAEALLERDNV